MYRFCFLTKSTFQTNFRNNQNLSQSKLQKNIMPKPQIQQILGQDRQFGGNQLFIDLIPRTCWLTSIRSSIVKSDWDRLRKYVYARVNNKCQCCGSSQKLQGHQRWNYDYQEKTQKLMRIVALCKKCHFSTHMGRAQVIGMSEQAKQHIKNVRKWTEQEYQNHRNDAFRLWSQRNRINWKLDITFITQNGLTLTKKMLQMQNQLLSEANRQ